MEAAGLASACIAGNLNKDCLLEYKMKINYPVINYKFVSEKDNLGDAIEELRDRPFTTCILQKGHYYLEGGVLTTNHLFAYNQLGLYSPYHPYNQDSYHSLSVRLKTYIDKMWLRRS
jgi:hypothetical protein